MSSSRTTESRLDPGRPQTGDPFLDTDDLEGLLRAGISQARDGIPHALLVFRVLGLAKVTEHGGASAEQALLDVICNVLANQFGPDQVAARVAPDTFATLHRRCLPREAPSIAARIKTGLEGGVFSWQGMQFRLGVTIGVLELGDTASPAQYLARAMRVCDEAGRLGGSGMLFFGGHPGEEADLAREQEWREHLREIVA